MEVEVTLRRLPRPRTREGRELIDYLLLSLGFDKNREKYREILLRTVRGASSGEISEGLGKRTTTIYHITKLVRAGMVVKRGNKYYLRDGSFLAMIEELERDVLRIFEDLKRVAELIDREVIR